MWGREKKVLELKVVCVERTCACAAHWDVLLELGVGVVLHESLRDEQLRAFRWDDLFVFL